MIEADPDKTTAQRTLHAGFAGPMLRALSLDVVERLGRMAASFELLHELHEIHGTLWELEDAARGTDATIDVKRRIDVHNGRRHEIIDRMSAHFHAAAAPPADARTYSETPGELCDRLLIIDLKIEHGARLHADAGLPDELRQLCISKTSGMRAWRRHLQAHLVEMLDDLAAGRARLPPRAEFKMYNDPLLNPVLRHAAMAAPRPDSNGAKPPHRVAHERVAARHILGIACTGHGASLAYLGPGGAVRASVLDRWVRTKNTLMFARDEAEAILGRVTPVDAAIHDSLAYTYGKFPVHRTFEDDFPAWFAWLVRGLDVDLGAIDLVVTSESHFATCSARLGSTLDRWLPGARIIGDVEHHRIHRCQAFWASGFPEAAVLTIDTCGEDLDRLGGHKIAGTIARMRHDGSTEVFRELVFPDASAGLLYSIVNHHVGFREGEEGKTMGLAPYGGPDLYDRMRPALRLRDDGSFELFDARELSRLLALYVPARQPRAEILPRHRNVAYAGQRLLEDIVANAMSAAIALSGTDSIAYAGGVALNSVANEAARRVVGPRRLYVPPNPGDTGHALGCALLGAHEVAGWPRPVTELPEYLGPGYALDELRAAARSSRHHAVELADADPLVARCVANGHIVARFAGRAEFGPRALGNRSILCDPRRTDMKDYLNARVKLRESFRPFAPSVLLERAAEWFDLDDSSPYMLRVVPVRRDKKDLVPAITHVDGTARLQTVSRQDSAGYWKLISVFAEMTGVPMVLNTSFNVDGQPIVETPDDAVRCFETTKIDVLVLGPWLLSKEPAEQLASRVR
jgi:carbamoyltransferase